MKPKTQVCLGIKHVGKPDEGETVLPATDLASQIRVITKYLLETQLAKRIVIVVGRDEEDIRREFAPRQGVAGLTKEAAKESVMEDMEQMLKDMGYDANALED